MKGNNEHIEESFSIFYKVMDSIHGWKESELKAKIIELNIKHLLDNLDKSLVQFKDMKNETIELNENWKPSEELEEKNFETWLNQYEDNKEEGK